MGRGTAQCNDSRTALWHIFSTDTTPRSHQTQTGRSRRCRSVVYERERVRRCLHDLTPLHHTADPNTHAHTGAAQDVSSSTHARITPVTPTTTATGAEQSQRATAALALDPEVVLALARERGVPEHLTYGITVGAMVEWLRSIPHPPADTLVEQVDANTAGACINGYVNQLHITEHTNEHENSGSGGSSYCEVLRKQGSSEVGTAEVFVSWHLAAPLETLLDALQCFLRTHSLPETTKLWVCDFCIRHSDVKADLAHLGACVEMVRHTVLLLDPWKAPTTLQRAYCLKEVYHTHLCGGRLDFAMSDEQHDAFLDALSTATNFGISSVAEIDVRRAECKEKEEREAILAELEARGVEVEEVNRVVIAKLRSALVVQASAVFTTTSEEEEGQGDDDAPQRLSLVENFATLLSESGDVEAARPLLEQVVAARRGTFGDTHPKTLVAKRKLDATVQAVEERAVQAPEGEEDVTNVGAHAGVSGADADAGGDVEGVEKEGTKNQMDQPGE